MKIDAENIIRLLCFTAIAVAFIMGASQCSSAAEDASARKEEARELTKRELAKLGYRKSEWFDSWEKIK